MNHSFLFIASLAAIACGSGNDSPSDTGGAGATPLPSEGCSGVALAAGNVTLDLTHAGLARQYLLHTPTGYTGDEPVPLIVNIHGLTSNMEQQELFSGMSPKSDAEGYLVAYPNGIANSWQAGACCANGDDRDDVGFLKAVVADIGKKSCIDLRRVYATGMSNGGFMSHRLGCEASDVFAAIAPVAGVNGVTDCNPPRPVPVLHFHGTLDTLVDYNGTIFPGVRASTQAWADRNGCTDTDPEITFQNGATRCETWSHCSGGVKVTLCTSEGEGHCWPGTALCPFGAYTLDINADDEMWKFFQGFSLP